jgi:hypothetical protein
MQAVDSAELIKLAAAVVALAAALVTFFNNRSQARAKRHTVDVTTPTRGARFYGVVGWIETALIVGVAVFIFLDSPGLALWLLLAAVTIHSIGFTRDERPVTRMEILWLVWLFASLVVFFAMYLFSLQLEI